MTPDRIICPRCGESLPSNFDVCDACGIELTQSRPAVQSPRPAPKRDRAKPRAGTSKRNESVPGVAWLLLVVGLAVGGMVGYALHSAVGPRAESGAPTGPADIMAGGGAAPGGAQGGAPQQMPAQVMQMVQGYRAALAKNPKDLDALIGLGNLDFDSGQWEKAIENYSLALEIDPKLADVRVDRAIAYHASGQNDVAKKELVRVTRELPTHKNAWLNLGVVNRELGDRPAAVQAWERYLELDPQGEHAAMVKQEIAELKQAG